jgi:AAA15 family ATPase/GTPase
MLIEFSIENYRSIADKQTISFVASKHRTDAQGNAAFAAEGLRSHKLLTSVVVYGANASGKTNLIRALAEFCHHIRNSAKDSAHDIQPCRIDSEGTQKPTRFELAFMEGGVRYHYGFSLDAVRVHEEWLIAYPRRSPQLWFHRRWHDNKSEIQFGTGLKGEKSRIFAATRPDALFLSVATQLNQEQLLPIYRALTERINVRQARHVAVATTAQMFESASESVQSHLLSLLAAADLGIRRVVVTRHKLDVLRADGGRSSDASGKRVYFEASTKGDVYEIQTTHDRMTGGDVKFDLADESGGTIQYFALLAPLMSCLAHGNVLAVDELDESLHPLLVRKIIGLFHDAERNPKGAQLLFNTHDTTLLDPELFRRDQIWFVEKEPPGKSRFYSLLDFSPRRHEALQKGYLQGRYGAIPFLGDFKLGDICDHAAETTI